MGTIDNGISNKSRPYIKLLRDLHQMTLKKVMALLLWPSLSMTQLSMANVVEAKPQVTSAKVGVQSFLLIGQP